MEEHCPPLCVGCVQERIFNAGDISVHFKQSNTRHREVHPKDKTQREKQSKGVCAIQCRQSDRTLGKPNKSSTKGWNSTDSAVHLHLEDSGHHFEDIKSHFGQRQQERREKKQT